MIQDNCIWLWKSTVSIRLIVWVLRVTQIWLVQAQTGATPDLPSKQVDGPHEIAKDRRFNTRKYNMNSYHMDVLFLPLHWF